MVCVHPWTVRKKSGELVQARCGWCIACRITKSREWSLRITHEMVKFPASSFVTLTYSPEFCDFNLHKDHIQKLNKRLRKHGFKYKYYLVGEYGDLFNRPHYHGIFLGLSVARARSVFAKYWPYGFVKVGFVEPASVNYVTKYVNKKIVSFIKGFKPYGTLQPPFSLVSKGLGRDFALAHPEFVDQGFITLFGKKTGVPRYYRKLHGHDESMVFLRDQDAIPPHLPTLEANLKRSLETTLRA